MHPNFMLDKLGFEITCAVAKGDTAGRTRDRGQLRGSQRVGTRGL